MTSPLRRGVASSQVADWMAQSVVRVPANGISLVEFVVIAGGGGGSGGSRGCGAGAGGYISSVVGENSGGGDPAVPRFVVNRGDSFIVTVGAGGAGNATYNNTQTADIQGSRGNDSVFGPIRAAGGGNGGGADTQTDQTVRSNGGAGGSGGAAWYTGVGGIGLGGQGYAGAVSARSGVFATGGGGGAGGAGTNGTSTTAGNGGAGVTSSITGTAVERAGGGAGAVYNSNTSGTASGGGGLGRNTSPAGQAATLGTANTGGGGGAGGGNGGSGVVILRFTASLDITGGSGLTFTNTVATGGTRLVTFTAGTGTITFV